MDLIKKYSNEKITVVWKPGICIHSKICFNGLPEVFAPQEKPWIKLEKTEDNLITEQIDKCPSGALSYYYNNQEKDNLNKELFENEKVTKA